MTSPPRGPDDPRSWQAALALVEQLLELPTGDRQAALDDAAADPEVRRLAGRLLQSHAQGGVLDTPLHAPVPPDDPPADLAGRRLGRWLLTEPLGQGGMSVVYRARSMEAPLGQEAALKLLSMGAATPAGRARFEREIDILVRLRHPGIAPVYDAGTAADGTPWFAMALVEGVDIETWCTQKGLDAGARVALFGQVCEAVEHAHRHLVIHRDIKPSNVMVNDDGRVVLLDFGISRMLEEGAAEATSTGTYAFTPRYAAPEQLRGGTITTATDVYSLGSLLHKLLLGVAPQYPEGATGAECRDPATLVRRSEDRALHRLLRGDLGAILRKAIAREPVQRYPGAAELAADLQAWQEGRPVAARQGGDRYRFGRFVARHKLASALVAALAASLCVGLATSLWQATQAREAAARAERELARAEAVRNYVARIFASANPSSGQQVTASDLLQAGGALVTEEMVAEQPVVAADLLSLIAEARRHMSEYEQAAIDLQRGIDILDTAGEPALAVRRRLHYELGEVARTGGRHDEAIAHYEHAVALARATQAPPHDQIEMALWLATARSAAGGSEQPLEELHRLVDAVKAEGLEGTALHLRALDTLSTATFLAGEDNFPLQAPRLEVAAQVYADRPGWLAYAYADAIPAHRSKRKFERAQELADASLRLADETYDSPHIIPAIVYCNAAGLALQRGRVAQAQDLIGRTLEMDRALERRHIHAFSCLIHDAEVHAMSDRYEHAVDSMAAASSMLDELALADDTGWRARVCEIRAWMSFQTGRVAEASEALDACPEREGENVRWNLLRAERAYHAGDWDEADRYLAPWRDANPLPEDAPDRLRGWQLDWALAARRSHAEAEARRVRLLDAASRIPTPWDRRDALLACLQEPGPDVGCL